jgi:hypothetical protein
MELSTLALFVFGILTIVSIICTIILYPGLRDLVDDLNKDSKENVFSRLLSRFDIQQFKKRNK